ncbi:hypothetical protein J6590_076809 [Homalodisca vitripennis]|nr:hypothetical protein J6590_076809 [Homalodisca vitripennis]
MANEISRDLLGIHKLRYLGTLELEARRVVGTIGGARGARGCGRGRNASKRHVGRRPHQETPQRSTQ